MCYGNTQNVILPRLRIETDELAAFRFALLVDIMQQRCSEIQATIIGVQKEAPMDFDVELVRPLFCIQALKLSAARIERI